MSTWLILATVILSALGNVVVVVWYLSTVAAKVGFNSQRITKLEAAVFPVSGWTARREIAL